MLALQEMLMQTDGKRILLGPAWPAEWDCEFKLHAPYQTTVEGRVAGGRVVVTRGTPPARQADLEILPLTSAPLPPSEGPAALRPRASSSPTPTPSACGSTRPSPVRSSTTSKSSAVPSELLLNRNRNSCPWPASMGSGRLTWAKTKLQDNQNSIYGHV